MYFSGLLVGLLTNVLKTGVTLLAIWLLWKVHQGKRGGRKAPLRALARTEYGPTGQILWWGLLACVVSELSCGIEIYILFGPNATLKFVHSYSSAVGAALLLYGTLMALDCRVFHYFDESRACAFLGVCKSCPKREGRTCKFHATFFWVLCFLVAMAVPILCIPVQELVADPATIALPSESLNGFFDREVVPLLQRFIPHWRQGTLCFVVPKAMTLAEFRHIPIASIVFGVAALVLSLGRRREKLSFFLACLAVGPLMYAYMEAALFTFVPHVYFSALGHETLEILGLAALRSVLYEVLRSDR